MHAIPVRRRLCCKRFVPMHQRSRPAPDGDGDDASTQAGSLRHGEHVQPGLTQRDMWVIHSQRGEVGRGSGNDVSGRKPLVPNSTRCREPVQGCNIPPASGMAYRCQVKSEPEARAPSSQGRKPLVPNSTRCREPVQGCSIPPASGMAYRCKVKSEPEVRVPGVDQHYLRA
ncbi:MAG: hypothetical protein KatS3mg056_3834 [Chloroflexus sp.]|jgi:hypothetical protein|nr:MAG: hypothetical protein KatS3mg056_3834 [Chloroflexus sp.]